MTNGQITLKILPFQTTITLNIFEYMEDNGCPAMEFECLKSCKQYKKGHLYNSLELKSYKGKIDRFKLIGKYIWRTAERRDKRINEILND